MPCSVLDRAHLGTYRVSSFRRAPGHLLLQDVKGRAAPVLGVAHLGSGGVVDLPPLTLLPPLAVPIFDGFARVVADRLHVPLALVSLVDVAGQALPGAFGLPQPWDGERWTPLSHSFCQHVVTSGRPFVVANAHDDPIVAASSAIMELGMIAYAGVPLQIGGGSVVGSISAIDHRPRLWTDAELSQLAQIAADCSEELAPH